MMASISLGYGLYDRHDDVIHSMISARVAAMEMKSYFYRELTVMEVQNQVLIETWEFFQAYHP